MIRGGLPMSNKLLTIKSIDNLKLKRLSAPVDWKDKLRTFDKRIRQMLENYPNFLGLVYEDGYLGCILVSGVHKDIPDNEYAGYFMITNRLDNLDMVESKFVSNWKDFDTPECVKAYKHFLEVCDTQDE